MPTLPLVAASTKNEPPPTLLFEHPGADLVIRSLDFHDFRVPRIYIASSSVVIDGIIQQYLDFQGASYAEGSLPMVQLPESGEILHKLLTFIFPVAPLVPSTPEETMELLSIAQKYQMNSVLDHIRAIIDRHDPLPTRLRPALRVYLLALKYGLRPEVLRSARIIGNYPMTLEDYDNKFDIVPPVPLFQLWKYHEKSRAILASDLMTFRAFDARGIMMGLGCRESSSHHLPSWLGRYIESIGNTPNLFDLVEFNIVMARHISERKDGCRCASIPGQTIRTFWAALTSVVNGSFEKASAVLVLNRQVRLSLLQAESILSLVAERDDSDPPPQTSSTASPVEPFDVPDANLIIRSSDLVNFRVHKPVLAMASPYFDHLLSHPQSSDSEFVDEPPVIELSEDSELLNCLISILYPVRTVIPKSYEKVLYLLAIATCQWRYLTIYYKVLDLLAACQKYDMVSLQSFIRAEVSRGAFPAPSGAKAYSEYAIASAKDLVPEMENAARQTLDHPLTFEMFGKGLEGWALNDLSSFRRRSRDNLIACLDSFLEVEPAGPSSIWVGCPLVSRRLAPGGPVIRILPSWLQELLSRSRSDLKLKVYTHPLDIHSRIREEYMKTLQTHLDCKFCVAVHVKKGFEYCAELEKKLEQARNEVSHFFYFSRCQKLRPALA